MSEPLLPTRFLFRFAAPCLHEPRLGAVAPSELGPEFRLPVLEEIDGQRPLGDVRAAWSEAGLGFSVRLEGKKHPSWCRESRLEEAILEAASQVQTTSTEVARHAWQEFLQAPKGSLARARFLRIVLTCQDDLVRILQSLGVIKRAPDEVLVGGLEVERGLRQLTDEQAQEALDFLERIAGGSESDGGEGPEEP